MRTANEPPSSAPRLARRLLASGGGHRFGPLDRDLCDWRDKSVADGWDRFDITGLTRIISEGFSNLGDGASQRVVGDKRSGPHALEDLFLRTTRSRFSMRNWSSRNDFGSRGCVAPFTVTLNAPGSTTTPSKDQQTDLRTAGVMEVADRNVVAIMRLNSCVGRSRCLC
jgi:hypothetical protein